MSKRIVIIGGMGPQASLELHKRIINQAAAKGAREEIEFPEIMHLSLPVPLFSVENGVKIITKAMRRKT